MLSSSLDALLKLSKTTSPKKTIPIRSYYIMYLKLHSRINHKTMQKMRRYKGYCYSILSTVAYSQGRKYACTNELPPPPEHAPGG